MLLSVVLSIAAQATPGPVGVFKSPDRIVQVVLRGEDQLRVRRWGQLDDGFEATFDPTRRELGLSFGDVLEFSEDYSTFQVRSVLPLFGPVRGLQVFTRLAKPELEQLVKATRVGESEAHAFLKALHDAQQRHLADFDEYGVDAKALGVGAEACPDGSHARASPGEIAGCRSVFVIERQGREYVGAAFGVAPEVKGRAFSISSAPRGKNPAGVVRVEKKLRSGLGPE